MAEIDIRSEIRFILNGSDVALTEIAPDATLLDWLRLTVPCAAPRKAAPRAIAVPARC